MRRVHAAKRAEAQANAEHGIRTARDRAFRKGPLRAEAQRRRAEQMLEEQEEMEEAEAELVANDTRERSGLADRHVRSIEERAKKAEAELESTEAELEATRKQLAELEAQASSKKGKK